jgi:hypothetical protein
MTTPAKASLLVTALTLAVSLAGCDLTHSDFDIAVGNRTANTVSVFANGERVGDVGSNLTATFTVEETPIGRTAIAATTPSSPGAIAQVTFSAQDMTTGALSAGVTTTLVKDITTYVDVTPCVLATLIDAGLAPPCLSVSSQNLAGAIGTTGSQVQACTFSLSGSAQAFPQTGGTGNVTVNTSNLCAWSATSSESWVTIVSGTSGTGTGVVAFQVAANTTGQMRTATLTIGRQTFIVTQG